MKRKEIFVHSSSFIDDNVTIGNGTQIWHFSHIMEDVIIGKNCKIGQNVFIGKGVILGDNVKIQNNVSLYSGLIVEDDVFCGPSAVFTNIKYPRSAFPRNSEEFYLKTIIKKGATIGANATVVCGITLGRNCFIGAGAVVTKDVPGFALVCGAPGKIRGWICECGQKIIFKHSAKTTCKNCKKGFFKKRNTLKEL